MSKSEDKPDGEDRTALFRLQTILQTLQGGIREDHSKVAMGLAEIMVELGASPSLTRYNSLAQELVRAVVREIEAPIRAEIAKRLAAEPAAARDVVKILANDEIEVAWPILQGCANLHDEDLVEVAINRSPRHRLAIAQRRAFSEIVSASLVCFSEHEIVGAVLRNPGARISEATFKQIGEVARAFPDLQEPLVRRADLPLLVAFGMLEWVKEALQAFLYDKIGGEENAIRKIVAAAVDAPALSRALDGRVRELVDRFVAAADRMSGDEVLEIMNGLPDDRLDLKIALTSDYIFEPLKSVRATVAAGDGDRFATICRAAEIPKPIFENLLQHLFMTRKGYDGYSFLDTGTLLSAVRTYTSRSPAQARSVLAALARQT